MIVAIFLQVFRCASDRISRGAGDATPNTAPVPGNQRRLPLRVHLWGVFLPPWPNYGASRMNSPRRPLRKG